MKVLLINGSPNKEGCTYTGLLEISKQLQTHNIESEIFWIGNVPIAGCIGCGVCKKTGECFRKDVVNTFNEKACEYDGYIFGSPVHFAAPSGGIVSFMDRAFFSGKRFFKNKPGAAILSCRRGGATASFDQLNKYFTISDMPIVSSQYWNMIHGMTPDEVKQDAEGMQTMRRLADNMAWILKCIEAGKNAGIVPSEPEELVRTSFIR